MSDGVGGGWWRRAWVVPMGVCVVVTFAKLWLVASHDLTAYPSLRVDDALFVRQARSVRSGDWLGPYDQLTLAKQPLYPMFVAATRSIRVPLLLAQHLLYVTACVAAVVAGRTLVRASWRRAALYVALVLNPMTFHSAVMARVDRAGITPALTLLLLVGLIGLTAETSARNDQRRHGPWPAAGWPAVGWSAAVGLSVAALWLTREEGILFAPAVVVGLAAAVWAAVRRREPGGARVVSVVGVLALPLLVPIVAVASVRVENDRVYGVRTVNEVHDGAFEAAFGALLRVEARDAVARFPLGEDVRRRIAAVSPAFAELEPWLEGDEADPFRFRRPDGRVDIGGLALQWVVRDAAAVAGHHGSAPEAAEFYRRLVSEVDDACERGDLDCGPPHAGTLPRPRPATVWAAARRAVRGLWDTVAVRSLPVRAAAGDGTPTERAEFAEMAGEPVPSVPVVQPASFRSASMRVVAALGRVAVAVGLVAGAIRLTRRAMRRRIRREAPLWLAALGAPVVLVAARTLGLAYIDVTMYPGFHPPYIAPSYAAVVLSVALVLLADSPVDVTPENVSQTGDSPTRRSRTPRPEPSASAV